MPLHPLIDRLVRETAAAVVDEAGIADWEALPGDAVLFFAGDPVRFPEGLDVAVVLPELHARFSGRLRVGIVPRECEDAIAARWNVQRWPSLVFVRGGGWLGTIAGMRDWDDYVREAGTLLAGEARRRPGLGIAVVTADAGPGCH